MKNFIKNNKFTIVAIAIFLVIVILLVQVKNIFFPSEGHALYGDRLNGIDAVEITKSDQNKIKSEIEKNNSVKSASVRISGKTVEMIITLNDDTSVDTAKEVASKSIDSLSDGQKKYYDFQAFLQKENDASNFPIIGYRHHSKDSFTFTKDRAES